MLDTTQELVVQPGNKRIHMVVVLRHSYKLLDVDLYCWPQRVRWLEKRNKNSGYRFVSVHLKKKRIFLS